MCSKTPRLANLTLLFCRNLFVYLKSESQSKVLETFQIALKPYLFLFMGNSESLGNQADAFEAIDSKNKIYAKKSTYFANHPHFHLYPKPIGPTISELRTGMAARQEAKSDQIFEKIFELLLPPAIVVDDNLNLIQIINDINPYIQLKSGKFS